MSSTETKTSSNPIPYLLHKWRISSWCTREHLWSTLTCLSTRWPVNRHRRSSWKFQTASSHARHINLTATDAVVINSFTGWGCFLLAEIHTQIQTKTNGENHLTLRDRWGCDMWFWGAAVKTSFKICPKTIYRNALEDVEGAIFPLWRSWWTTWVLHCALHPDFGSMREGCHHQISTAPQRFIWNVSADSFGERSHV